MSIEEFEEALARLGGKLDGWPPALRRAAEALIATSPSAGERLLQQQQLDAQLAAPSGVKAPPGLVEAILARARKTPQDPGCK
jgi:hypothetical protein